MNHETALSSRPADAFNETSLRGLRILVAIAHYGTKNRPHADRLIETFRDFGCQVDIVVLSEAEKDFPDDIEVRVGLPSADPWSLPFAHRPLFIERRDLYDLFIYTEDDTEILERHVRAFLGATRMLPDHLIPGFIRYELGPEGISYYSTVHAHYHWDVRSIHRSGAFVFARYTNDHSACFLLTRDQLARCIDSGGFVVEPHAGAYDMLCSAATDPYTRCGFTKVICVSHIEDFSLHHLPDLYLGRIGVDRDEINRQIGRLLRIGETEAGCGPLIGTDAEVDGICLAPRYFEEPRDEAVSLLGDEGGEILSVGCGRGLTEEAMLRMGYRVTAVPLDCVIAESAWMRGVETTVADFDFALETLADRRFDVVHFSNVLSYVPEPAALIRRFAGRLAKDGVVLVSFDNHRHLSLLKRRLRNRGPKALVSAWPDFARSGIHRTGAREVRRWLREAGFRPVACRHGIDCRHRRIAALSAGLLEPLVARTGAVLAARAGAP